MTDATVRVAAAETMNSSATTILFTDIEGSSALVESLGDRRWMDLLRTHNAIVRRQVEDFRGFEVKTVGDGFMVAFPKPAPAVDCAVGIQRALAEHNAASDDPALRVRIGVHTGEAMEDEGDFFGREVVMAARVAAQAAGGEILVSDAVSKAGVDVRLAPPRTATLKGLRGTHRLHPVVWGDDVALASRAPGRSDLQERDSVTSRLQQLVGELGEGRGVLVTLSGGAGLGKTALLTYLEDEAATAGIPALHAHGSEIERPFAFGVARQILEDRFPRVLDAESLPVTGVEAFRTYASLTRMVGEIAREAPLLIVVDDAHWADDESLGWLGFLARRTRDRPVLLAVAARDDEPDADERLEPLWSVPGAVEIRPEPLTAEAVARIVGDEAPDADPAFVDACHRASGGVPFYVKELLATARAAGIAPDRAGAAQLPGMTPEGVRRLVLRRLRPLGEDALLLARACATLDTRADIRNATRLAGLSPAAGVAAADRLVSAGIFRARRPLGFAHPIMQTVVQSDTSPGQRSRMHRAAANLLAQDDAPSQEIAVHLLAIEPMDDPDVPARLHVAAAAVLRDGSPASALRFLERALEEPPPPDRLEELLHDATRAAQLAGRSLRAMELARRALGLNPDKPQEAKLLVLLARAAYAEFTRPGTRLGWDADVRPIVDRARALADDLDPGQRSLRYELEAIAATLLYAHIGTGVPMTPTDVQRLQRLAADATGDSAGEREILGAVAGFGGMTGSIPLPDVLATARRALEDGTVARELGAGATYDSPFEALIMCDAYAESDRHLVQAAGHARRYGVPAASALIAAYRCDGAWFAGALDLALDFAAEVAAHLAESGPDAYLGAVVRGAVCGVLIVRGELDAADSMAGAIDYDRLRRHAQGLVSAARGDHEAGAMHLRAAQDVFDRRGVWRSSGPLRPVRPDLARALAAVGERDEARRVVEAELEVARRFGAPSCIAEALRAQAGVEEDPEPLREAARIIKGSEARLVEASVLLDLHRMTGDAAALERGHGIAERCGAVGLVGGLAS